VSELGVSSTISKSSKGRKPSREFDLPRLRPIPDCVLDFGTGSPLHNAGFDPVLRRKARRSLHVEGNADHFSIGLCKSIASKNAEHVTGKLLFINPKNAPP